MKYFIMLSNNSLKEIKILDNVEIKYGETIRMIYGINLFYIIIIKIIENLVIIN